ncbi:hypothetical protein HZA71_02085 [Candidatus Falkowbacteria bacterium]|nr:hypothetical protein [Candidatus Falkowbacteria bacterium]
MVAKLFLLQFYIFGCPALREGRGRAGQKDFHRSWATAQIFLLALLVSPENIKFRDKIVLPPSRYPQAVGYCIKAKYLLK